MRNIDKTHCKSGHEFTTENTYSYRTSRGCRICREVTRKKNAAKLKAYQIQKLYGISMEIYQKLIAEQEGHCFLCEEIADLVIDHNHETNEVRRLLCGRCNLGLGLLRENPELLRKAADYCEAYNDVGPERSSGMVSDIEGQCGLPAAGAICH